MEETRPLLSDTGHLLSVSTSKPQPPPALETEELSVVEDNVVDEGLKTPTSALSKIHPTLRCPPAPRKPKAVPLGKRKGSHRLLDLSNDVLSLYPPVLLADFGNKLKKGRTGGSRRDQQQQQKENIFSRIN